MPRPLVLLDWGSMSITRTWAPSSASAAPRFMTVVVLPTPPFWFATAMVRGVEASPLNPSCANVTTWVCTAGRILFGKSRRAYSACKEEPGGEEYQGGFSGDRKRQPSLRHPETDQGVVGDVGDDRRSGVGEAAQGPEAEGQHENGE